MDRPVKRVFWLGMHHVLKKTELPRLRALGYEVFNPAYISPLYDQSADRRVDWDQSTTLPADAFTKLLAHDFFYTTVPAEIGEILNAYFDAVIVTIHAGWLKSILDVYHGRIIYRVYGQPWSLAEHLIAVDAWKKMIERSDVQIVPFAAESVEFEHPWFLERCTRPVPYQLPDDVFSYTSTWSAGRQRSEVGVSIPNIEDPYYSEVYHRFQAYPEQFFRILGPQRGLPADPRVMGRMDRDNFLRRLGEFAGYFYPYTDNVCYLPPIEMMQVGGPVVYLAGSLLARFGDPRAPGLAGSRDDALRKLEKLIARDKTFADEVISAQEPIRRRYDRALVQPIFDEVFCALLGSPTENFPRSVLGAVVAPSLQSRIGRREVLAVPLHHQGLFSFVRGKPSAFEGIPRVVDMIIDLIVSKTAMHVIVSCTPEDEPLFNDFFKVHVLSNRLSIYVVSFAENTEAGRNSSRLAFVNFLNSDAVLVRSVFVPHYYIFPECLLLKSSVTLYLPDYLPYLMPEATFEASREADALNKQIGVAFAQAASRILTNSQFTKEYLSEAGFVAPDELAKVVVAPLPLLGRKRADPLSEWETLDMRRKIDGRPFLFYPTANRPNKKLAFFMHLLAHLRLSRPNLCAVMTCDLRSVPEVADVVAALDLANALVLYPGSSDGQMRWFFENTAALCLTSVAEGNFPPQVLEALSYKAPVVATRLPTIMELGFQELEGLLLCEPLNLADFADKLDLAIDCRSQVISRQASFFERLRCRDPKDAIEARLGEIFLGIN